MKTREFKVTFLVILSPRSNSYFSLARVKKSTSIKSIFVGGWGSFEFLSIASFDAADVTHFLPIFLAR